MTRMIVPLAVVASLAVAGCNETNGSLASGPDASTLPPTNSSFGLPPGSPCSGEIARYEGVVKSDLRTGNVEQKVFDQIQAELKRAAAACRAGHGGESHSIVAASKSKHGYRA